MIIEISADDDRRVRDFVSLTDMSLRKLREPVDGVFIAEGDLVIRRALDAGFRMRSMLMARKWATPLADVIENHPDVPVMIASDALLESITGFAVHRGALASFHREPLPSLDEVIERADRIVILEDIVNHTNVGAIFRSAAALGVQAVLVTPRCADPLYRRSIKVSMGAVFTVPWTRVDPWPDSLAELRARGMRTLALSPSGSTSLRDLDPPPARWALILGTEGAGLSAQAVVQCDDLIRIPMSSGVDSLNVAAASAVACYALAPRE